MPSLAATSARQRRLAAVEQRALVEQVVAGVGRQAQFGKGHQRRAGACGLVQQRHALLGIEGRIGHAAARHGHRHAGKTLAVQVEEVGGVVQGALSWARRCRGAGSRGARSPGAIVSPRATARVVNALTLQDPPPRVLTSPYPWVRVCWIACDACSTPPPRIPRARRAAAGCTLTLLLALLGACGGGDGADDPAADASAACGRAGGRRPRRPLRPRPVAASPTSRPVRWR